MQELSETAMCAWATTKNLYTIGSSHCRWHNFEWYNNVEHHLGVLQLVAEMHYRLVYIHPFRNGNGRCARLLANFVLARKGWRPIILKELMRMTYYDTIHHADKTGGPGHGDLRPYQIDDDFGPDPDDDLDTAYTDTQGNFDLSGDTTELTTIDPHLKICGCPKHKFTKH
ncbi:hypothetical protein niasHS_001589 [Heterodera schachtii]|uniref:Fido domain-containing protein n=1 Tax=Heterodera schachtii TaxID=97005 RepID=A0ABD2KDW2_HETSC